jgi:hypothetical protein
MHSTEPENVLARAENVRAALLVAGHRAQGPAMSCSVFVILFRLHYWLADSWPVQLASLPPLVAR